MAAERRCGGCGGPAPPPGRTAARRRPSAADPRDMRHEGGLPPPPPGTAWSMITPVDCATCGTRNAPGVATCVGCGRPLAEAGAPAASPGRRRGPAPGPRCAAVRGVVAAASRAGRHLTRDAVPPPPGPRRARRRPTGRGVPARRSPGATGSTRRNRRRPAAARKGLLGAGDPRRPRPRRRRGVRRAQRRRRRRSRSSSSPSAWCRRTTSPATSTSGESAGAAFADFTRRRGRARRPHRGGRRAARRPGRRRAPSPPSTAAAATPRCATSASWSPSSPTPTNAAKAEAWADVLGIEVSEIETYVAALTAVRLRWDTRVTNHGFRDGEATPFQSLLQAGTAVLVDDTGVPRVKCNCGNPLGEPAPLGDASESDALDVDAVAENPDEAWEGLDPARRSPSKRAAPRSTEITLVDVDSGGLIERPVGSDGASKPDVGTGDVQVTLTGRRRPTSTSRSSSPTAPRSTTRTAGPPPPAASSTSTPTSAARRRRHRGGRRERLLAAGRRTVRRATRSRSPASTVDGCGSGDFTLDVTVGGDPGPRPAPSARTRSRPSTFEVP